MKTDATRHDLFCIIALLAFNKVACSNLGLAGDPMPGPPQTYEWKILKQFLDQSPEIDTLDIGGGLGVPLVEGQKPLDLDAWSKVIARHANRQGLEIHLEPGDYLVKDADVLLLQVNPVEEKGGIRFVGVNGGFNIQKMAAYYQTPFIVTPLTWKPDTPKEKITLAGNINESIDILAEKLTPHHFL